LDHPQLSQLRLDLPGQWERASNTAFQLLHMPQGVPTTATVRQAVNSTFGALPEGRGRTLTERPRKTLGWNRPTDLFDSALASVRPVARSAAPQLLAIS
jgi:hypothetical protein